MSKHIAIIGSCSVCHVFKAATLPDKGETLLGSDYYVVVGGKGSGQATVAYKLGGDVHLLERLGNDVEGRGKLFEYKEMGIHTEHVHLDDNLGTGRGGIFLDQAGHNKIVIVPGANSALSIEDIDQFSEILERSSVLGAQLEVPLETVAYALRLASRKGIKTVLDPAPVQILPIDLYPHISIIKPNEVEASALTGIEVTNEISAIQAGQWFIDRGVKEAAVITLGSRGAVIVTPRENVHIPGIPVHTVDTGGAGDTFAGALIVALAKGWDTIQSVCYAVSAASYFVTKEGAYSLIEKKQVDAMFKKYFEEYYETV